MKEHRDLTVVIEQDSAGNYIASVPELKDCHVQGKSMEEVQELIKQAIEKSLGVSCTSIKLE